MILQLQQAASGGGGHPIITYTQPSNIQSRLRRWRRGIGRYPCPPPLPHRSHPLVEGGNFSASQIDAEVLLDIIQPATNRSRSRMNARLNTRLTSIPSTSQPSTSNASSAASGNQSDRAAASSEGWFHICCHLVMVT